ncbi:uncharacterized protein LOC125481495 [Rhincodon typus]|uniref:uncharacterized protein LOC125481495 n=1 Tax=Rhincodon typus TaxID=259920 RepID=UPI00202FBD46|nr:uncharacterized protein LOC125481495 [Rhincodon typus]
MGVGHSQAKRRLTGIESESQPPQQQQSRVSPAPGRATREGAKGDGRPGGGGPGMGVEPGRGCHTGSATCTECACACAWFPLVTCPRAGSRWRVRAVEVASQSEVGAGGCLVGVACHRAGPAPVAAMSGGRGGWPPNAGPGAPPACLNGPLMNQRPSVPIEQGYRVVPPAPYSQQQPAKNFPHLGTEQHLSNFQTFGQTASRPLLNATHLQKGSSADGQNVPMAAYPGSYSRMPHPSQGSFTPPVSSSVLPGVSVLPQPSWQYSPQQQPHPISQLPGVQANHVIPAAGTGQGRSTSEPLTNTYGSVGPKPAMGNQYENTLGGSFGQNYTNQGKSEFMLLFPQY